LWPRDSRVSSGDKPRDYTITGQPDRLDLRDKMTQPPEVSIVVALLDQEGTIEALVRRAVATLEACGRRFEIVLVDDGSRDRTVEIIRALEAEDERVRVFELTRNYGQAAALACGIFAARGAVVTQMDGDLQNPPEEVPKLLEAIAAGAGVATGCRGSRYEGALRWLGSRAMHWLARWLTGSRIEDFGGNFKAYRRDVVEAARSIWAPGKPFFPLTLWLGFPVTEVVVRHDPPWRGESRYTFARLLRINLDLVTAFTTVPLAALGVIGFACLGVGLLWTVICWLQRDPAPLAVGSALALVVVGANFVAAGVLGQYLGRVYRLVAGGGPAYVVGAGPRRDEPPGS
jgi:undecaprenyl-phosphate 4-deoxy-4-formamido-L-arabinose transferase